MDDHTTITLSAKRTTQITPRSRVILNGNRRFEPALVRYLPPSVVLPDEVVRVSFQPVRKRVLVARAEVYGIARTPRARMRHQAQWTGTRMRTERYEAILK